MIPNLFSTLLLFNTMCNSLTSPIILGSDTNHLGSVSIPYRCLKQYSFVNSNSYLVLSIPHKENQTQNVHHHLMILSSFCSGLSPIYSSLVALFLCSLQNLCSGTYKKIRRVSEFICNHPNKFYVPSSKYCLSIFIPQISQSNT